MGPPPLGVAPAGAEPDLARACEASVDTIDPYFGLRPLRGLEARLPAVRASADAATLARLLVQISEHRLRVGRQEEARQALAEARALAASDPSIPAGLRLGVLMQSAVAALRQGERANCQADSRPEACILPLRGGGIHRDPEGSRAAIGFLEQVLALRPADASARYLLNIAHMTLGTYPDSVPPAYRMPGTWLEPEADIGRFPNVAPQRGVDVWSLAGGAVLEDLDGDGHLDMLVSDWNPCAPLRQFRNLGDGRFEDVSVASGAAAQLGGLNLVQADYDNDGDTDVLVLRGGWQGGSPLGLQRNSLLANDGTGHFTDVTRQAGLADPAYPTQSAAWADYDLDGDLDLYVCNEGTAVPGAPAIMSPGQLFVNAGDGTFRDVAPAAGVTDRGYCKGAVWGDFDADGWPDLYLSNHQAPNRLFRNRGDGTFNDVAPAAGVTGPPGSFPTWFWDYDNDGRLDLFVGAYLSDPRLYMADLLGGPPSPGSARIYRNLGGGRFADLSKELGIQRVQMLMGANFGDLDNDGWLDFYGGVGSPNLEALFPNPMLRGDRGRRFQDVTFSGGFGHLQKGHGIAFGDVDGDGDQDVLAELGAAFPDDGYANALFLNPGQGNHFLKLHLVGRHANRGAVGARVKVLVKEAGTLRELHRVVGSGGSFGANPMRLEVGLGQADAVERVEVLWPVRDARPQVFTGLEPDHAYRLEEGEPAVRPLVP